MDQKNTFFIIGSIVLIILIVGILYFVFQFVSPQKNQTQQSVTPTFNQEDILKSLTTPPEQKITPQTIQQNEKTIQESINTPPASSKAPTKSPSSQELTPTEQEILKSINTPPSQ